MNKIFKHIMENCFIIYTATDYLYMLFRENTIEIHIEVTYFDCDRKCYRCNMY